MLLSPTSVALIGASVEEKKLGHYVLRNLTQSGFKGKIFPVNPKHDRLLDLPCFPSVGAIAEPIDLAIVVTPAATVAAIAEECGKKGVQTLVVISAGFSETGTEEGKNREAELVTIGKTYDMRIIGPNCLGLLRPSIGLNGSFAGTPKQAGPIALISQSGAMAVALLDRAESLCLSFSSIVSIGNKADLDEANFLEILEHDPETRVIGLYLESIKSGVRFMEVAARVARKKPIVLIKSGVSARGAKAVSSHTGALAGSEAAMIALCEKTGIHHAKTTDEFMGLLATLCAQPPLVSSAIAVITNAGGPGVLATDAADSCGLELASLDSRTIDILRKTLPAAASAVNPIDVLGDALADRYGCALSACARDPLVDGLAILLTPQVMTPCEEIARTVVNLRKTHPLLPMTTAFMGGGSVASARSILRSSGIPSFETPEEAMRALASLKIKQVQTREEQEDPTSDHRALGASALIKGKKGLLNEEAAAHLLALYDLEEPKQAIAKTAEQAQDIAATVGLPVVLKISSPDILHKTDVGGIRVNIKTKAGVKQAYNEILKEVQTHCPLAAINGVLVQQFLPIGSEFIIGGLRDSSVGPMVMVGLGGIYTELFHDTCFRIAPVTTEEAYEMLSSLKAWKLLLGMRGKKQLAIEELANVIVRLSQLLADSPSIQEIDLNPVLVGEKSIVIADAKVVVEH